MQDYTKLGFKSGLEIHQQLDTGKLFCSCPGYLRSEEPHFTVSRKLHAVAGETGAIDEAVKHEATLDKTFIYQGYKDTTCLVELDEEPPHQINEEALNEVIKIALLLNCEIYPVTQIMRKTVINGSNTSGFQRTLLLAHDGFIETSFGKVPIDTLCLEEDAARIISKDDSKAIYRLDRLGIPLVEIATSPVITNPKQIKETALKIGEILRACKVKRGIGTIRQDINVSIKGHDRVEKKGFQDPAMMDITAQLEVERQLEDIKNNKTKGEVRNALPNGQTQMLRPMPGKDRMYPETDLPLLKISRDRIISAQKNLPKLKSEIKEELKNKGVSEELMSLVLDGNLDEFTTLCRVYPQNANLVAKMITLWRAEFSSKYKKPLEEIKNILTERILEEVLEAVARSTITENDVRQVLIKIVEGKSIKEALRIEKVDDSKLEEQIAKIISEKPGLKPNAYMGTVIAKLGHSVDKRKAMEILNKLAK